MLQDEKLEIEPRMRGLRRQCSATELHTTSGQLSVLNSLGLNPGGCQVSILRGSLYVQLSNFLIDVGMLHMYRVKPLISVQICFQECDTRYNTIYTQKVGPKRF